MEHEFLTRYGIKRRDMEDKGEEWWTGTGWTKDWSKRYLFSDSQIDQVRRMQEASDNYRIVSVIIKRR